MNQYPSYQKQTYQQQSQFTVYLQYTIDTDMQNVLSVCMDYLALLAAQPDNFELLSVFKNRMILQLNLSNTIHLDLQENAQQIRCQEYARIKEGAKDKFQQVFHQLSKKYIQLPKHQEVYQILEDHLKYNLSRETKLRQSQLEENGVKYQFGEKVVQQLITAMQYQDQQYSNLSKQQYQSVSLNELYNKSESRYFQAQAKIKDSGVQQKQCLPENYPEGVKKLLNTYYLILTAPNQYKGQLQSEFKETIIKLRMQKSALAINCLTDFSNNLNNAQLRQQIKNWVDYIGCLNHNDIQLDLYIPLEGNDLKQFQKFQSQSQGVTKDYEEKRNIVDAVKLVLLFALSLAQRKVCNNPLQDFDLSLKDQLAPQFLKLSDQFKSKFMRNFCLDVANQRYISSQAGWQENGIEEDIALLRRLTS